MAKQNYITDGRSVKDENLLYERFSLLMNLRSMRDPLACIKLAGELLKDVEGTSAFSGYKDFLVEVIARNTIKLEEMINILVEHNAIDNEPDLGSVPGFDTRFK